MPRLKRGLLNGLVLAGLWLGAMTAPARAQCEGKDLLVSLSPARKAQLIDGAPYPAGNLWRATKGDSRITLVGTYHLNDPRFASIRKRLAPILARADSLLVEAAPRAQARLRQAVADNPGYLLINDGPTLPERLPEADWQKLAAAMQARGVPAVVAAKLQPWYVSTLLAVPPCALEDLRASRIGMGGLDQQLITMAEHDGIPIGSLEPWDTSLKLFKLLGVGDQMAMIRAGLAQDGTGADMFTTMSNAYFRGEHQLVWAFERAQSIAAPGADKAKLAGEFARLEDVLLTRRNQAWIGVLTRAATHHHIVAAFGAAHLGGQDGVLNLLHARGWTITRLDG